MHLDPQPFKSSEAGEEDDGKKIGCREALVTSCKEQLSSFCPKFGFCKAEQLLKAKELFILFKFAIQTTSLQGFH